MTFAYVSSPDLGTYVIPTLYLRNTDVAFSVFGGRYV